MVVLDASAAVAMLRGLPEGEGMRALVMEGERVLAPELYVAEVTSVFSKLEHGGFMTSHETRVMLEGALGLVSEFVPMSELAIEAQSEGRRLAHSPYDMFYFVLARRNACPLLTLDRRLNELCMTNMLGCVYEQPLGNGMSWTIRAESVEGL